MMKIRQILVFIFLIGISLVLSACRDGAIDIDTFASSVAFKGNAGAQGYEQRIEMKYEGTTVYLETRTLEADGEGYKLTSKVLLKLNDLEEEVQFREEEERVERFTSFENNLGIDFRKEYFLDGYEIRTEEEVSVFTGRVKAEAGKLFMKDEVFAGTDLEVTVTIDSQNRRLKAIVVTFVNANGSQARIETTINY